MRRLRRKRTGAWRHTVRPSVYDVPPPSLLIASEIRAVSRERGRQVSRQGPRFSIRMVIGIFCSDTETGAATPPGVMQKK